MIRVWVYFLAVLAVAGAGYWGWTRLRPPLPPIKVGLLHSLSGPMAISEKSMVDAELMAIDELNNKGGLLGRRIEPVVRDNESQWHKAVENAETLIEKDHVSAAIGCWTSASRKAVKPVFEKHNHLLIYPKTYEGLEESPNIVYTGGTPNQQIIPAVKWACDQLGKRFFLVGTDNIWPRAASEIAKDQIKALGGVTVGEAYLPLDSTAFDEVIAKIKEARPSVILSTVMGDSNQFLYRGLAKAGLPPAQTPVISFSIAEDELRGLPAADMAGDYCVWSYFQSLPSPENKDFVARFKARYGADRVTSDVIEAAYFSVLLWAQAVVAAGDDHPEVVRQALMGMDLDAPEGIVSVDKETQHSWRPVNIGKIRPDGQFEIVWSSEKSIRPMPFPLSRSRTEWEEMLKKLYTDWGGSWTSTGKK